jgi:glycosyltransferase involved in cell wall biosynthesis
MKILVVSQYFWPEEFRINDLVKSLAERGVDVDVLTGKPNYPEGKIYSGYRATGSMHELWQGANVFRVPIFPRGFRSGLHLFLNYLSFIFSGAVVGAWKLRDTESDIIFVYAPSPLLQALPALFIGWIKRIPVVVYVQDLWPESLEATGYVRNRLVIRIVDWLVRVIYQNSDLILVSSRPFKDSIQRFLPSAEIIYYPNSVDASFSDPKSGLMLDLPVLDDGFCIVFAGNVGAAQAVHVISEAAEKLRDYHNIRLVVLGSGSELEWLHNQSIERGLTNLFLAGRFPVEAMPNLLSRADALLVTLSDRPIFAATVPNKIQAYMAVGRPIIAAINGEGARLVQEAEAGISVPAEDSEALAEAILKLFAMPAADRDRLGENGRRYYRQHFDHEQLVAELIDYLTKVIKGKK